MSLQQKVVIVTGGNSGIGRSVALALAQKGMNELFELQQAALAD